MAEVQSKLLVFALEKLDGYVLIDSEQKCLPFRKLDDFEESNGTSTFILSKDLFGQITSINSNWPSLFFTLSNVSEYIKDNEYIIDIVYSVYLEGIVAVSDGYEWKKISSLSREFIDYDVIVEAAKKRYV